MKRRCIFQVALLTVTVILAGCLPRQKQPVRWWPEQAVPAKVVMSTNHEKFEPVTEPSGHTNSGAFGATHIMTQSLAGLAAKAVNRGTCDEMVWIQPGHSSLGLNPEYATWYEMLKNRLSFTETGMLDPWKLVERFRDKGIVKGYVLYSFDASTRGIYRDKPEPDNSVQVATSLAAIHNAILISQGQKTKADALGLEMLADARGKTMQWLFDNYRSHFRRDILMLADPKTPNNRDYAIANDIMTFYGTDDPVPQVLDWLEPLSPIVGWNGGDESKHTAQVSRYGHFHSASDMSLNLPLLSAGAHKYTPQKIKTLDPRTIDFDKKGTFVSFIMSDGDNMQWYQGDFLQNKFYWGSEHHGSFPVGWGACLANLTQMSPDVVDRLAKTQPDTTSMIEFGAGYFFPDLFAAERQDRPGLLAEHASRISRRMEVNGTNIFGYICRNLFSDRASQAFDIFAKNMDNLIGMITIDYAPYNKGMGKVYWVKKANGNEIPVVTARYALWDHDNKLQGGPEKLAGHINEDARAAAEKGENFYAWTVVHAWSGFRKKPDGTIETAPYLSAGSQAGLYPVKWTIDRLDKDIHVVSPEELIWRIRYDRDPEATIKAIK